MIFWGQYVFELVYQPPSIFQFYYLKKLNYKILNNVFKPGVIIGLIKNVGIIITTKTDPILLLEAKLEGKKVSSQNQLIQQLNPSIGENFSD